MRLLALLAFAAGGQAAVIFNSGYVTFTPTGTQFGRLFRDGISSNWAETKAFPGVTGAPAARSYQTFAINPGPYPFLQILLDDPAAVLFDAAYLNSFNPVNTAPNYGLNVNYLGDPGNSEPFGNPSFFQIRATPNSRIIIAINEVNPGAGAGATFNLLVEGFYSTDFSDIPEPATPILFASGIAALYLTRLRKSARVEKD